MMCMEEDTCWYLFHACFSILLPTIQSTLLSLWAGLGTWNYSLYVGGGEKELSVLL